MNALAIGAVLGALGVVVGAFGAHALAARLAPEQLATFQLGARYQLLHAVALVAVGVVARQGLGALRTETWCFTLGVVLFSGSLYGLALGGPRWLGPLTPVGGTLLIAGWVALAWHAVRPGGAAP